MTALRVIRTLGVFAASITSVAAAAPQSATVLAFGDANTLFVADSRGAAIHAYQLSNVGDAPAGPAPFNLLGLEDRIAEALDMDIDRVHFHDVAVHPVTTDAYVSATLTSDGKSKPAVMSVTRDGKISRLDLSKKKQKFVQSRSPQLQWKRFFHYMSVMPEESHRRRSTERSVEEKVSFVPIQRWISRIAKDYVLLRKLPVVRGEGRRRLMKSSFLACSRD